MEERNRFCFFFVFHPVIFSEFSNTVLGDVHFQEKPMAGCRQNEHIFEGGGAHCFTDSFLFLFGLVRFVFRLTQWPPFRQVMIYNCNWCFFFIYFRTMHTQVDLSSGEDGLSGICLIFFFARFVSARGRGEDVEKGEKRNVIIQIGC